MSCFFICDSNYLDQDVAVAIDYSSEDASYLGSNLEALNRRGRVWRSAGYFEVTSSNNKIIFRDDASTNIEATITVGEYTSLSSFLTAVDSALEAVGVASYTISQDTTTGKIKFASDLSGGATAFQLITTDAGFTAADLLGFDTTANLTGASNYVADVLRIHSSEYIEIDLGMSSNIQAAILVGKNRERIKISPTATIKLQGNMTSNFSSPQYEGTFEYNDEAMYLAAEAGFGAYRFWRISIEDKENPNYYVELSKIFIGECWFTDRGCPQFGLSNGTEDLSVTVFSESGTSLSEINNKTDSIGFDFDFLTKVDAERLKLIFEEYGTAKPLFCIFDDEEVLSSEKQKWAKLVKFTKPISITIDNPGIFSSQLEFREEI